MPYGLQCWDATGFKTLDTNHRAGQMLGQITLAANHAAGSVSVPGFAYGDPWWIVLPGADANTSCAVLQDYPTITATYNSLNYGTGMACTILYGIF